MLNQRGIGWRLVRTGWLVCLWAVGGCAHLAMPGPYPTVVIGGTYAEMQARTQAVQRDYTQGYATIGFAPPIMTIPDRPFLARRTYEEWRRGSGSEAPMKSVSYTVARDSIGRIHYESSRGGDVSVILEDPVLHVVWRYSVSRGPQTKWEAEVCRQPRLSALTMPVREKPSLVRAGYQSKTAAPKNVRQELGVRTMDGLEAVGQLEQYTVVTDRFPPKRAMIERWLSPELGLNLLEVKDFEGQNKMSVRTDQVQQIEPDASLFALPLGYSVRQPMRSCGGGDL